MQHEKTKYSDIHAIIIFLVMCSTMNLSFTWPFPTTFFLLAGISSSFFLLATSKDLRKSSSNIGLCALLGLFCVYLTFISPQFIIAVIKYCSLWICACSIILLTPAKKERLLAIFTISTAIIIAISLPVWILYLMGFSLPHGDTILHENGFHTLTNYYFFVLGGYPEEQLIPRFASMFLEPGQLATPCVFLIFGNNCNFRNTKVLLLLLAVIFSFSLIGYGLLVGGLLLYSFWVSKKHRILKTFFMLVFFTTITLASIQYERNPVYSLIIRRLEYDEDKGIIGNNRTSAVFNSNFELMMKNSNKYFGIAKSIDKNHDWTLNTSGIKKFIVMYGLVGLLFLSVFFIVLLVKNWSMKAAVFFMVVVVGFVPRSMLLSPYWLFICLTAIPVLTWQNKILQKETE